MKTKQPVINFIQAMFEGFRQGFRKVYIDRMKEDVFLRVKKISFDYPDFKFSMIIEDCKSQDKNIWYI